MMWRWCEICSFFFFQAEDGIRDLVRSRGLGDVYKRQEDIARSVDSVGGGLDAFTSKELVSYNTKVLDEHAVSYTHLTLPTSDLV